LKDLPKTASHIVFKAASILEEELAAGIAAAKDVEERFIDVTKARSASSNELLQKFREHVHAAVDIGVDLVYAASKSATKISEGAVSFTGSGSSKAKEAPVKQSVPAVSISGATAGNSSSTEMTLENGSDKPTDEFRFYVSDLISSSGTRIPASSVRFEPGSMVIKPRQSGKVLIVIAVPKGTSPGTYSGLIQATNLDQLRALLNINVQ